MFTTWTILFLIFFGLVLGGVVLGLTIPPIFRVLQGFFWCVGEFVGRCFGFIGGVVGDLARLIGAAIAAIVLTPLVFVNVILGRWSGAGHFSQAVRREIKIIGRQCWSIFVRRPLRLLFLDSMLEGVEVRALDAVREAPGPDQPRRGLQFDGFEIVGSLPSGGSGAKLYIARPDEKTRARLEGRPDEVVIKSFALAEGSSLPQIVRESRSLESGRRLGLVLAHELDETQFWYAMPYHPGDHLGVVVRDAHQAEFEDGLRGPILRDMLGYVMDLVRTLDRYHGEGLWHKDVKPDNIIVHDGSAHLVDFGLVTSLRSAMTLTTHGTEYFRDPEMVRMAMRGVKVHEVDGAKFDVYGAGAVLYYVLENTFPGHGGLSRFERPAPEALRWIVRRAMADYGQRYGTAIEMLEDLQVVANAADPSTVTPAMLPSMGGETPIPAEPDASVRVARTVAGRPSPPPVRVPGSPVSRPTIQVANWWTGAVGSSGGRSVVDQVREAQARARDRRSVARRRRAAPASGSARSHRSIGTVVRSAGLAFGIAIGIVWLLKSGEPEYRPGVERTSAVIDELIGDQISMVTDEMMERGAVKVTCQESDPASFVGRGPIPEPLKGGAVVLVDDRTSLDGRDDEVDLIQNALQSVGWRLEKDLDSTAGASMAMFECRNMLDGVFASSSDGGGTFLQSGTNGRLTLELTSTSSSAGPWTIDCEALRVFQEKDGIEGVLWVTEVEPAGGDDMDDVVVVLVTGGNATRLYPPVVGEVIITGFWPDGNSETRRIEFNLTDENVVAKPVLPPGPPTPPNSAEYFEMESSGFLGLERRIHHRDRIRRDEHRAEGPVQNLSCESQLAA